MRGSDAETKMPLEGSYRAAASVEIQSRRTPAPYPLSPTKRTEIFGDSESAQTDVCKPPAPKTSRASRQRKDDTSTSERSTVTRSTLATDRANLFWANIPPHRGRQQELAVGIVPIFVQIVVVLLEVPVLFWKGSRLGQRRDQEHRKRRAALLLLLLPLLPLLLPLLLRRRRTDRGTGYEQ